MKFILYSALILPGLACVYFMFIRRELEKLPPLRQFYAEANGFWAKVWALCGKSLTIAWSYIVLGAGMAVQAIDPIASALGDPDLKTQVTGYLQANPKALGYFAMVVSMVTILSRLKSIGKTT